MKRLILFFVFLAVALLGIITGNGEDKNCVTAQIYVVDVSMMRLISLDCELVENTPSVMASEMVSKIINGFDKNKKIRRIIPDDRRCIRVNVEGRTAFVDIRTKYFKPLPQSRELEKLLVYQLVNSLTSIDGIEYVQFTVDGDTKKEFAGFVDMREIFVSDYLI